ncbi:MAG: GxxExxY protein [Oryzomonas sp.]|uniref:GxxExxY protein n=1 Tax=Oryzomonas sp. TaxID=2855186 RepID=UPI00284040A2|nr:GxxExxY protein [Oryzomonas sp.]MDR3578334.1 GxxExxY protein [Oryzomonas sp.]
MLHIELTDKIIGAFYNVYNVLGSGFLEKVYENALAIEFKKYGLSVSQQERVKVYYEGVQVGDYFADIIVDSLVILELKAAESLRNEHFAQLTNYLKATDMEVGLLLNFGKKPEFKRIVMGNNSKVCFKRTTSDIFR